MLTNGGTASDDPIGVMPNLKAIMGVNLADVDSTAVTEQVVSKVGKVITDGPISVRQDVIHP